MLESASCFGDFVVLVQVNAGMLDMWCNWYAHYQQLDLPQHPVYVVAYGEGVAATLTRTYHLPPERVLAPPRMAATATAGMSAASSTVRNFGSASFYALNTAKIRAARDLMSSTGRAVVFSDIDTVWLRSPLAELARLPPSTAFAIGPEGSPHDFQSPSSTAAPPPPSSLSIPAAELIRSRRHYVCACFFAACPRAAGRVVLDKWWAASGREDGKGNEQVGMQWMINLWPELVDGTSAVTIDRRAVNRSAAVLSGSMKRIVPRGVAELVVADDAWAQSLLSSDDAATGASTMAPVSILPHAAFPTGRNDPSITSRSVWMHANWIQRKTRSGTTAAKRTRLAKHGKWMRNCTLEVPTSDTAPPITATASATVASPA